MTTSTRSVSPGREKFLSQYELHENVVRGFASKNLTVADLQLVVDTELSLANLAAPELQVKWIEEARNHLEQLYFLAQSSNDSSITRNTLTYYERLYKLIQYDEIIETRIKICNQLLNPKKEEPSSTPTPSTPFTPSKQDLDPVEILELRTSIWRYLPDSTIARIALVAAIALLALAIVFKTAPQRA